MRVTFIPWVALSVLVLGSSEVALPSDEIETITRDICLAPHSRAESLESLSGGITLQRDAQVSGNVETDSGAVRIEGAHVGGRVSTTYGDIYIGPDSRIDGGIVVEGATPVMFAGEDSSVVSDRALPARR